MVVNVVTVNNYWSGGSEDESEEGTERPREEQTSLVEETKFTEAVRSGEITHMVQGRSRTIYIIRPSHTIITKRLHE